LQKHHSYSLPELDKGDISLFGQINKPIDIQKPDRLLGPGWDNILDCPRVSSATKNTT
jgi:hypothetical protein